MKIRKKRIQENGITLIALVVTIIVLLILAGLTISIALNENGLIARAKDASAKYAESADAESKQLDSFGKSMQDLSGLSGNEGSSSSTGTGNTNAPSVTFTDASGNKKTVSITASNAKDYYGWAVSDYNSTAGGTYRVFYYDANGDFEPANTLYLKRDAQATNVVNLMDKYGDETWKSEDNIANRNAAVTVMRKMNHLYTLLPEKANSTTYADLEDDGEKGATWLCDKTQFTDYVDTRIATYALGATSVEMFLVSYNQLTHPNSVRLST